MIGPLRVSSPSWRCSRRSSPRRSRTRRPWVPSGRNPARSRSKGLQTLSQEFLPANRRGSRSSGSSASPSGTPEYYGALQKRLDAQTSVLFEGVGGDQLPRGPKSIPTTACKVSSPRPWASSSSSTQSTTNGPNFMISDMTPERLNRRDRQARNRQARGKTGWQTHRHGERPSDLARRRRHAKGGATKRTKP